MGQPVVVVKKESALEVFERAQAAVKEGEARNLKEAAMRKRWKAYFAAEDAVKEALGVWA